MLRPSRVLIVFALLFANALSQALAEPVLVVKKSFPLDSITRSQAADLWLAKTKSIGKLRPVFVVDLSENHPLRQEFYKKIVGLSGRQLEIYWDKKLFSGKVVKPKTVDTELDVIQMVTSISGVIGYVDVESVNIDLKILTLVE
jgi:ABC-type phosphate transport system substrate-binding protein